MPIPNTETELVMERMKNAALSEALIQFTLILSKRMSQSELRIYRMTLAAALENISIDPVVYGQGLQMGKLDLQLLRQNGLSAMLQTLKQAFHKADRLIKR